VDVRRREDEAGHKAFQAAVDDGLFEIVPVETEPRGGL
jgi:hypothetical protein